MKSISSPLRSLHNRQAITSEPLAIQPGVLPLIRSYRKYILLICIAVAIVYLQAMTFDFVTYDDYDLVLHNENFLGSFSNILTSFTTHAFAAHRSAGAYYRPLVLTSFIVDYYIWNLNPMGYHLTNVLLHCVNVVLCFLLLAVLLRNEFLALFGSLFFAFHPAQVQAVAWVAGRNDLLAGLFVLLMMLFFVCHRSGSDRGNRYYVYSMVFFGLALFSKESAAASILFLPLYDVGARVAKKSWKNAGLRKYLGEFGIAVLVLAGYFAVRYVVFGEMVGAEKVYGQRSLAERLSRVPALFSENLSFVFAPVHLSAVHPVDLLVWLHQPWNTVAALLVVLSVVVVWWMWKKDGILGFGISWFIIGLVPALDIIPIAVPVLENRLYLPMVGGAIVVARAFQLLSRTPAQERIVSAVLMTLVGACAVCSFLRLPVWRNSVTLWSDAIAKEPTYARPYVDLAGYYYELGSFENTVDWLKKYLELQPRDALAYSRLRETYYRMGKYEESASVCRKMITLEPNNPDRYLEAALLSGQMNQPDSAVQLCKEGLQVDSNYSALHYALGLMYDKRGDRGRAEYHLHRAIELKPGSADAYFALGSLYGRLGDDERAIYFIEQGMSLGTPPKEIVNALLLLYAANGRTEQAKQLAARFGLSYR